MLKKGEEGGVTLATDMTRKHSLLAYPAHGMHQQGCCLPELYPSANLQTYQWLVLAYNCRWLLVSYVCMLSTIWISCCNALCICLSKHWLLLPNICKVSTGL